MTERLARKDGEPQPRYPYIGMIGPVGVGKTFLAEELATKFHTSLLKEDFRDNPHLEPFYTSEHPERYSFDCQVTFLAECSNQLSGLRGQFSEGLQIHDSSIEQNLLIARAQAERLGWMTDGEYEDYKATYRNLTQESRLPEPDIYLVVVASKDVIKQRILGRGREMEVTFMEGHSEYYDILVESVEEWVEENRKDYPIYVVNK
ncbi:deoxynucleoside kinase, partial [Patescibacteria group bacterium]|nr:deoxynucleoside kinase [Patescibacteria group bacterium]